MYIKATLYANSGMSVRHKKFRGSAVEVELIGRSTGRLKNAHENDYMLTRLA